MGFNKISSKTVNPTENTTENKNDVARIPSVFLRSLAPTAWDRRMLTPLVAPIAIEFRIKIKGVAPVSAA